MPAPAPKAVDQSVVNSAQSIRQRAAAAAGYSGTIKNDQGASGILTPAFTTGKSLTGQ
jgi:hypothetical protein